MTTDHREPIDALDGEVYVELVSGYHVPPHQVSFPAVVDERRRNGLWARPRFRREVAEAVAEWLNLVYPLDPDWYPLARLDGDTFLIIRGDSPHQQHVIEPDADGRYTLGSEDDSWFLSIPTLTTAAHDEETELLGDPRRRITTQGEVLVSCSADDLITGAFPATVDPPHPDGTVVPTFRPEIVEALAAWCNKRHRADPDQYPQAYFEHGVLVHVDQHLRALDGYTPWRITPRPGLALPHRRRRVGLLPRAGLPDRLHPPAARPPTTPPRHTEPHLTEATRHPSGYRARVLLSPSV